MVFAFDGVAHPPPFRDGRKSHPADMCSAQIATTNLGRNNGTPLLVEHDRSAPPVGKVLASWEGRNGELRVTGIVDDQDSQKKIMDGSLQGLSLGTGILLGGGANGTRPLAFQHEELSLCHTPARVGCYIDKVNGSTIRTSAQFSNGTNGSATSALRYALTCTNSALCRHRTPKIPERRPAPA